MTREEFIGHVSVMRADAEFLGAEDIMDRGDVPVQIEMCERHTDRKACGRTQKEMFTLRLKHANGQPLKKEFWLKATNRKTIVKLYGANVGEWKGKWLWLYTTMVKSPDGGEVLGIRIREKKVAPEAKQESAKQ